MTERSSFFNDVNGDRLYKAEDWANYFNKFITNGVFPNIGSNLQVFADGTNMNIRLSAGAAWIKGYMYENTDNLILPVTVADGVLNRIDRVVIQLSYAERKISAKVKQGAFASSPVAPTLQRDADIYELGIADITVSKGITSVKQSTVTDLRLNTSLCGIVGSLAQPDTTAIFNQYQDWFNLTSTMHEEEAQIWLTVFKNNLTLDEQEFDTWFESIKGKLNGDTAAKLASDLASITQSFSIHQADYVSHTGYTTATGTANTYIATLTPALSTYKEGVSLRLKVNADNTGTSTVNVNGLGPKTIKNSKGSPVVAGNLKAGVIYTLVYDGENFILQGEGGSGDAIASDLLSGKKASTDAGEIVGTLVNRTGDVLDGVTRSIGTTSVAGSGSYIGIPEGAYIKKQATRNRPEIFIAEPSLSASNIVLGKTILGVAGNLRALTNVTSGDKSILLSSVKQSSINNTTLVTLKQFTLYVTGTVRIKIGMVTGGVVMGSGFVSYIYKNSVAQTGELSGNNGSDRIEVYHTVDVPVNSGDTIQIRGWAKKAEWWGKLIFLQVSIAEDNPHVLFSLD
ncbi:hypothetical protein ABEV54_18220 [Peribacillus psychrosaccharolyticus]|uniref:hypothetical protein n=1 Tax=Peribacillus psychrosaccharolyticus TaxID=1407 RepID=UPI003D28FC13